MVYYPVSTSTCETTLPRTLRIIVANVCWTIAGLVLLNCSCWHFVIICFRYQGICCFYSLSSMVPFLLLGEKIKDDDKENIELPEQVEWFSWWIVCRSFVRLPLRCLSGLHCCYDFLLSILRWRVIKYLFLMFFFEKTKRKNSKTQTYTHT